MSILAWIGLGLVGGAVVGWLWGLRGRALLADGVVGVLGAVLGGFLASVLLGLDIAGLDGTSILVAAVGAGLLILILHALPARARVVRTAVRRTTSSCAFRCRPMRRWSDCISASCCSRCRRIGRTAARRSAKAR